MSTNHLLDTDDSQPVSAAGQSRHRTTRHLAPFVLALVAALCALAIAPADASAAGNSRTNAYTVAYTAPTPYASYAGGFFSGSTVTMICWTDNVWSLGTNRWFLVEGGGYNPYSGRLTWVRGFVSANRVSNQQIVGHC